MLSVAGKLVVWSTCTLGCTVVWAVLIKTTLDLIVN